MLITKLVLQYIRHANAQRTDRREVLSKSLSPSFQLLYPSQDKQDFSAAIPRSNND